MLKLATILDNPGEPHAQTRYRDPKQLKDLGYNGLVIYETTGLSGIDQFDRVGDGEIRRWVTHQFEDICSRIDAAHDAGLSVYILYDVLSLVSALVTPHIEEMTCRNRTDMLCPASAMALDRSAGALRSLLGHLPDVEGIVLRFGDNDASRLPYLVGNDIYLPHCARCSQLGRADRTVRVLEKFHNLVVDEMGLRLIARAWNVRPNGMHDSVELCQRIASRLPGVEDDDRFVLSFKFTQTDFWRYQQWNPSSLVFGKRPILYELQCQREFEGKGGVPNWQVPLWRDGPPEMSPEVPPEASLEVVPDKAQGGGARGLADVADKVNFAGLWAWVRGGGWGGPFVKNETWIDANAFAVPALADDPKADPVALAQQWIAERAEVTDPQLAGVLQGILEHSPQVILNMFYLGPYAQQRVVPWHPNADWVQDDVLDVEAAQRIIERLPEADLDTVVREKADAVKQIAADRAALQQHADAGNRRIIDPLIHTLVYAESFTAALRELLAGLVAFRRYQRTHDVDAAVAAKKHLLDCQNHWNKHSQRHSALAGAATAFREAHLWEVTDRIVSELEATS